MKSQKSKIILAIIISILITVLLTSGIFYFWEKAQKDLLNQTITTLQNQNQELTDTNKELKNQFDTGEIIDEATGLSANDYMLFNKVITEILPRICLDQQKQNLNLDNPICILNDIDSKGGDATEVLKKYRDSL